LIVARSSTPRRRSASLAVLGSIVSFYIEKYRPTLPFLEALFVVGIAGASVFAVLSVVWLIRSYVGYVWRLLPPATELERFFEQLKAYDAQYGLGVGTPTSHFEAHLLSLLVDAATRNSKGNNQRSHITATATVYLVVATVFTLLAGLPLAYEALNRIVLRNF
jgi:hypothetical protein